MKFKLIIIVLLASLLVSTQVEAVRNSEIKTVVDANSTLLVATLTNGTGEVDTTLENVRGGIVDITADIGGWSTWDSTIVNFAEADWLDVASSQWLKITGNVELEMAVYCSTAVTVTSADTLNITDNGGTVLGSWMGADIDAGEWLSPMLGVGKDAYPYMGDYWRGNVLHGVFAGEINGVINDHVFASGILVVCWRFRNAPYYGGGSVASGNGE